MGETTGLHQTLATPALAPADDAPRSAASYRAFVEQCPLPMQVVGRDGHTRVVNAAWERLWGVPFEALRGYDLRGDRQLAERGILAAIERAFAGETVVIPPSPYDRAANPDVPNEGGTLWLRTVIYGVRDASGDVDAIVLLHEDVTRGQRAEERARSSAELFARVVEKAAEGVMIARSAAGPRDAEIVTWNRRMTEITGYTKEEIDRLGWYDALYPDPGVRADAVARRDRILAGDEVRDAEWSITTANGERRHLSVSASRTPLEDGEVGVLTLVHDVTEKHAAALALAESERRHRAIFDESIAAIFLLGPGGRFVDANPAGLALLGYTRDELRALTVADVDADPESVPTRRAKLLADRRLVAHEHRVRRKDGRVLTVLDNTSVLAHGPDAETRAIATLLDITEHKHAEAERERLHEALDEARRLESVGRLAGGVAHDYNNMLGVILGSATAAIDLLEEGHPAREELEEVRKAATRSADLTRQLLGFARRQPARPEVLDLDERVAAALKMLARVVREDVRVLYSPGVDVPHVRIDPAQLDQILVNLAANARDAIAGTGTLRVETSRATIEAEVPGGPRPGTYAVVRVRDDGAGMSEDVRAHAFEPFFTTKGVGRGTGLGLATVHGIVKQNGGEVSLESAPGRGTVVTIHLPAQARAPRSAKALAAPPRGGAEVVLLVEDEPAVLRLVERTLRRLGYTVLAAPSPWEATRLAEEHDGPIDLLLTDVIMPGTSGRELARTLLATRPAMRTLFMSGYPAEEMSREGLIAEGAELVQKPFTVETLYASVRRALDGEDARSTGSPTRAP